MKICHLTSVHPYNDIRIFVKECRSLADAGYETHLVAVNAPEGIYDRVVVHNILQKRAGRWVRIMSTTRAVYRKALEIDAAIYHFHDPELLPAGLLLAGKGKTVVYDVHEDLPRDIAGKTWIWKPARKAIARAAEAVEHFAAKRLDAVIAATPHIMNRFRRIGCRTVTVNNYPLMAELTGLNDRPWSGKRCTAAYIGRITAPRGLLEMVGAIAQTDGELLLAGAYDTAVDRDLASALEGWGHVSDRGLLDRGGVAGLLFEAMVGLAVLHPVPGHRFSQPIKLYEYMAAGIPVICSDFPEWRRIVEAGPCGICVDPLNADAIAVAVQWVFDHPAEAEQMGRRGQEAVRQQYNWETECGKLLTLYKELADNVRNSRDSRQGAAAEYFA